MSDQKPENETTLPEASPPVDPARRKLTGAALGAGAVFTLSSRPVWANNCTISGMASGNLSRPGDTPCAGCTPGYWKQEQHFHAWVGYKPVDKILQGNVVEVADTFNAVFGVSDYKKSNGEDYTLLEVLHLQGNEDPISPKLGAHAVAALLNAASDINYGYTSGEIIILFNNNKSNPEDLKDALDRLNNRGCPLGDDPDNKNLR